MEKDDFWKLSMYQVFDKMENFQPSNSVPKMSFIWKGKIQVFQAPTGYSTADKAFIAVLCDNIWTF